MFEFAPCVDETAVDIIEDFVFGGRFVEQDYARAAEEFNVDIVRREREDFGQEIVFSSEPCEP